MKYYLLVSLCLLNAGSGWAQQEKRVPNPPHNLSVFTSYQGATAVAELKWKDGSDDELGFEILRSDNGKPFQVVGIVGTDSIRFEDKIGRYITGSFLYKVRAFNEQGKSEDSNSVSIFL